ncbi:GspH/FimT family protein [Pseudomonas sp. TMP9]|uniref:GspH/FimT family protein n=1 Tax=Pseudomonas sp. TMP9 TaxID=3133144 RepID=UPI0030D459E5
MRRYKIHGYSLLELLITLALLALLMGIATPALSVWHEQQKLQSLQSELFSMTYKARYLAMTSQHRVTLCPLTEEGKCQQSWSGSISSFIDTNGNRELDAGENVFSTIYVPESIRLNWRGMLPNNSIHFSNQGVTFVSNGTMSICPSSPTARSGTMVINRQGRVKTSKEGARCP